MKNIALIAKPRNYPRPKGVLSLYLAIFYQVFTFFLNPKNIEQFFGYILYRFFWKKKYTFFLQLILY